MDGFTPKELTLYATSDERTFSNLQEAKAHQATLNINITGELTTNLPEYTTSPGKYANTIAIWFGEKAVMSFGLKKAIAILECIDAIKAFVESHTNKDG